VRAHDGVPARRGPFAFRGYAFRGYAFRGYAFRGYAFRSYFFRGYFFRSGFRDRARDQRDGICHRGDTSKRIVARDPEGMLMAVT